jgi:hypothetical protein
LSIVETNRGPSHKERPGEVRIFRYAVDARRTPAYHSNSKELIAVNPVVEFTPREIGVNISTMKRQSDRAIDVRDKNDACAEFRSESLNVGVVLPEVS